MNITCEGLCAEIGTITTAGIIVVSYVTLIIGCILTGTKLHDHFHECVLERNRQISKVDSLLMMTEDVLAEPIGHPIGVYD